MKKTRNLPSVFFLILLIACSENKNALPYPETCIPSDINFSYQLTRDSKTDSHTVKIPPSYPWEEESELPDNIFYSNPNFQVELAHSGNNSNTIWVKGNYYTKSNIDNTIDLHYTILIYDVDNKRWSAIPNETENGLEKITLIFLDKEDKIWGVEQSSERLKFLSQYNEENQTFERINYDVENFHLRKPIIDKEGIFWFVGNKDIYRFNPPINDWKHFTFEAGAFSYNLSNSIGFDSTKRLYLMVESKPDLFIYDMETEALSKEFIPILYNDIVPSGSTDMPDGFLHLSSFFVDSKDNIWFHDYGWREPNGNWNRIIRSPLFVIKFEGAENLIWEHPKIILESKNGLLWFDSSGGLTSLDPKTGSWCRITTEKANIIEDSEDNLWLLAYGKLYSYLLPK